MSSLRATVVSLVGAGIAISTAVLAVAAGAGEAAARPVTTGPVTARAGAPAPGSRYVALGDSYAAGYGIGTSTGKPVAGCAQSTQDYPHQLAAKLKLKLSDVSCSGAVTANIDRTPQDTGNGGGTAARQDTALSTSTKLVTVTIGGNDLGFSSIAEYCLAVTSTGPVAGGGTNCKAHYDPNGVDSLAATVRDTVVPRVARVLADIKRKAPHAAVYFVDYPAISTTRAASPDPSTYAESCFSPALPTVNSFPFTATDIPYLQQVQRYLNAELKKQVTRSGDHFVESYPQSLSHSACAGTPDPWMNGITLGPTQSGAGAEPGSLHPNREGADHLAAEALAAIGRYVAPASSSAASGSAHGSSTAESPESAAASPVAAGSAPLAGSGAPDALPLAAAGALLVLTGAVLLYGVRFTLRRSSRGR